MNVAVMKTKAEQAYVEQFEGAAGERAGNAAVREARKAAIGRFASLGLPHRRIESWKYTDLRAATKEAFPLAPAGRAITAAELGRALGKLAKIDAVRIVFVNGRFAESLSRFDDNRGRSYHFDPTATGFAATSGFDWMKTRLADPTDAKGEAVIALNTAFATDGVTMKIAEGAKIAKPFHLVFISATEAAAADFTRNFVGIGAGAEATIIESHLTIGEAPRQSNSVSEIAIHEGARLSHAKIVGGRSSAHIGSAILEIDANAIYNGFQFTSEAALTRNQSFVRFGGQGGKLDLSGVFLGRGHEHIDTTLVVDHAVPHCTSRELFKGVLDGEARGVFQGKIIVAPNAQKTDGKQMSQALMLSPDAEFDSKPELEIFADDVVCGHGTTSAELDPDLLFYCRSRGIPEEEARALMVESFVGEAIDKIEHDGLREALADMAKDWLAGGKTAKDK